MHHIDTHVGQLPNQLHPLTYICSAMSNESFNSSRTEWT
ncbi:hypothetical protein MINT15_27790 [Saccharomonospora viridis]|jgi:hypothetical protein|uniref:Uncharacterized protein n=1 Tax=Saccharomonospora viridis TaxID=1852 RepID=A0A837D4I8_9PSEU|nr:hypothetical protein MINT15_27790 [Saccharomonospora viridis]